MHHADDRGCRVLTGNLARYDFLLVFCNGIWYKWNCRVISRLVSTAAISTNRLVQEQEERW